MYCRLVGVVSALGALSTCGVTVALGQTEKQHDADATWIAPAGSAAEGGPVPLATGFEPPPAENPGFNPGPLNGQSGWTVFSATPNQPQVSTANPQTGLQHIRLTDTTSVPNATNSGGFSPVVVAAPNTPSLATWGISINNTTPGPNGGADYDVAGQSPAQQLVAWRVKFEFTGNILVLDDPDGPGGPAGLGFQDTGADWTVGTYHTVGVAFDPAASQVRYTLNGNTIYTGNTLIGANRVEQVVLLSDNFFLPGESGDFDNLNVGPIPEPATLALSGVPLLHVGLRRRKRVLT